MVDRGLEASCGGPEISDEVLPSETGCWRGVLLLGALSCTEDVLTTGGRGRLVIGGLCWGPC